MTSRPSPIEFFKQSLKSDAFHADEIINIYLLRPVAAIIVWLLYPTRVTPNQVTMAAIVIGCLAALSYALNTPSAIAVAGVLVTAKDIFDDADGQLARLRAETHFGLPASKNSERQAGVQAQAKQQYSRRGRFLDSIGDFVVDVALFTAITYVVYQSHLTAWTIILGILSLLGITLRVSYHVFYQVSFFHLEDRYKLNRIIEEITEEERRGDPVALRLQIVFNLIYTWQDKLMYRIDEWCKGGRITDENVRQWYADNKGLRISGLLGFGTEFALLTICSLLNQLYLYLWLNVVLMNGIWAGGMLYRRSVLSKRLK